MQDILFVCDSDCLENGRKPGGDLYVQLRQALAGDPIEVRLMRNMTLAGQPVSLGLRGVGKAGYVFADLTIEDAEDTVAMARQYLAAQGGEIADTRLTGRLRDCLLGTLPAG